MRRFRKIAAQGGNTLIYLSQDEADALIKTPKRLLEVVNRFPEPGEKIILEAISDNYNDKFLVDINRGSIVLFKCSYHLRVRTAIGLVRLDTHQTRKHQNPDGTVIGAPHLHIYREGYGLKWAQLISDDLNLPNNLIDILHWFFTYCKISINMNLQGRLLYE